MKVELFTDPTEAVVEFRGVEKGFLPGTEHTVFQIVVPVTTFEESPEGVFNGNNITVAVGKDFFKIEEGKREFFTKPITNSEQLRKALRGQVSQNPVEEQQVVEDEPQGGRRVQTFRTSSKRVSKNGRRLTRKSRHGRKQHGQH
jgi:hypothetical protein